MFSKIHSLLQLHAKVFKPFETLVVDFFIRLSIRYQKPCHRQCRWLLISKMDRGGVAINNILIYNYPIHHIKIVFTNNVWKTGNPILRAYCFSGLLIVLPRTSPPAISFYIRMSQIRIYIYFITAAVCVQFEHLY